MADDTQRMYDSEHTLAWSLLLMEALHKSGISPCSNGNFHRLIYFGNALARLYEFQPPAELVMRMQGGPFYPRAQQDLDRLCVMGLARVCDYHLERVGKHVYRRGEYDISDPGFLLAVKLKDHCAWACSAAQFLSDLCVAFSSVGDEFLDSAEKRDPTYRSPSTEAEPVINFGELYRNLSLRVTRELRTVTPAYLRPIPQQSLRLYLRYIEQLAA